MRRRPPATQALARIDRPEAVLIALVDDGGGRRWLAGSRRSGWRSRSPAQLAIGGIGAVLLIGPARPELGFARYATLATAGVALTLFGRLMAPGTGSC